MQAVRVFTDPIPSEPLPVVCSVQAALARRRSGSPPSVCISVTRYPYPGDCTYTAHTSGDG